MIAAPAARTRRSQASWSARALASATPKSAIRRSTDKGLPPLRDRLDDLPILVEAMLRESRATPLETSRLLAAPFLDQLREHAKLSARGKPSQKVATAIARELLGFVWAIAVHIEHQQQQAVPTRLAA